MPTPDPTQSADRPAAGDDPTRTHLAQSVTASQSPADPDTRPPGDPTPGAAPPTGPPDGQAESSVLPPAVARFAGRLAALAGAGGIPDTLPAGQPPEPGYRPPAVRGTRSTGSWVGVAWASCTRPGTSGSTASPP
jgi:hypothetical protein